MTMSGSAAFSWDTFLLPGLWNVLLPHHWLPWHSVEVAIVVAAQPLAHGHTFLPRHAGLNAIPFRIGLAEKLSELSRRTSERDKSVGCPPSTFGWRWLAAASSRVPCQPFIYSATWDSIAAGCAASWSHCFNNGGTGAAFAIASCGRKAPTHQLLCQSPAAKAVS